MQRMAARCALEEMGEQLEFSEACSLRAETIMATQQKMIRSLEAKLYNLGVLVPEVEKKDSDQERWVAGIAERKKERARAHQRRRENTAEEALKEMSVWNSMKQANAGIDPKLSLTPRADVLWGARHGTQ